MMEKVKRTTLAALYAGGCAVVALLLLLAAVGPKCVLFPEAMLPMELRELASAWLAVGFLPMVLVSEQFYQTVRRKIVFLPSAVCLVALLFWVGVWTVGMVRSPAMTSDGDIILPQAEKIMSVHLTGSELDLTTDGDFIGQLLHDLSQAKNTGRASIQDVPDQGAGLVRIDLNFWEGGTSTLFLYRDDGGLMVEQPYQGIYEMDEALEIQLRTQIALELAAQTTEQE
ncbi:MAG: DUF5301 domain-containing protein [Oscillibacter sp.]|nr:DUF5301 domain-containing protein [Oscillibacter sp.]